MDKVIIQKMIDNPDKIDPEYINKELSLGNNVIVKFSDSLYTDEQLSQLNELCEINNENLGVRFYELYSTSFDFKTLLKIPNVKNLSVDCTHVTNIEILTELKELRKLSFGIFELEETEILNSNNLRNLNELVIGATKTKKFNLEYLRDYKNLRSLTIEGHTKNIDAVGELSNLEYLCLHSIKKISVSFINKLKKLKTLKFILGSRDNILEVQVNEIETLEIIRVRGFTDISNITNFKNLKTLLIEDNVKLNKINFSSKLAKLNDLKIINCKTLDCLEGLENQISLKQLRIYKTNLDFNDLIKQKMPSSLKTFAFYTVKKNVDEEIVKILKKMGYLQNWT